VRTPSSAKSGGRRVVRLADLPDESAAPDSLSAARGSNQDVFGDAPNPVPDASRTNGSGTCRAYALPASRDDWLVLAERVVGDWAGTLRAALLLVLAVAAVIMAVGLLFGVGIALATAFLALLVFLVGRRRGSMRR
jgi:hypothetical protein